MRRKPIVSESANRLRRSAEAQLKGGRKSQREGPVRQKPEVGPQRLLHELEVHKIELELQNAELRKARDELEVAVEKYTDLYDFAPVGYFSLDEQGLILEANLRAAILLGVERRQLLNRRFALFVPLAQRAGFLTFFESVFEGSEKPTWEGSLLKGDGNAFPADFRATLASSLRGTRRWCRIAVLVMSAEAQSRMEALVSANHELKLEVARREATEKALQESQRVQGKLLDRACVMQEELRHLSHQILHVQEEERKRISRELHDQIAQTLVGLNVHLAALTQGAGKSSKGLNQRIARAQKIVEESVNIVHQFARELRPTVLDDLGLIPALHAHLKAFATQTGVRTHLTAFAAVEALDAAKRTVLYRIAQEALSNVARHAEANRVEVTIQRVQGAARMEITDDGKSFDVERVLHAKGNERLGLLGMRERVEMVRGTFGIQSAPGQGTTVRVEIPLASARKRGRSK